jgi:RND family efflux transporter MFP subunit
VSPRQRTLVRGGGLAVLVLGTILWASGAFHGARVGPGDTAVLPSSAAPPATATAVRARVPVFEEAVGTVRSRRRVVIAAQVPGRVVEVGAEVGDTVAAGARLVAIEAGEAAARFTRARAHYERVQGFLARRAATQAELEAAEAEFLQAKAALDHTTIASPIDGVVAERAVEPGDLAWPGRALLEIIDPRRLRLEAQVREGAIGYVTRGARLDVALPATGMTVAGTVAEVLPAADPQSRTFTVRVNLAETDGVHPGMFGRLRLPVGEREIVAVPARALVRVGQLEMVRVRAADGRWTRRLVTSGRALDDGTVEILSGLAGGETIGVTPGGG